MTTDLLEEVYHLLELVAAITHDVTLDQSIHITRDDAGRNVMTVSQLFRNSSKTSS